MGTLHLGSLLVRDEISDFVPRDSGSVLGCCRKCVWVAERVDDDARPSVCVLCGELWVCDGRGAGGDCPPWGQGVGGAGVPCRGDPPDRVPYSEDAVGLGRVRGRVPNVLPFGCVWAWSWGKDRGGGRPWTTSRCPTSRPGRQASTFGASLGRVRKGCTTCFGTTACTRPRSRSRWMLSCTTLGQTTSLRASLLSRPCTLPLPSSTQSWRSHWLCLCASRPPSSTRSTTWLSPWPSSGRSLSLSCPSASTT